MHSHIAVYFKFKTNIFTTAETKTTIVVILLEIKIFWSLESDRRGFGRQDTMQSQAALIIIPTVATNEIHAWPLLCEAQRHDLNLVPRTARVAIVQLQPTIAVKRLAYDSKDAGDNLGR